MYRFIPLHSCDYIMKISIKINVATDEGNSRNEIGHWTNSETGTAGEFPLHWRDLLKKISIKINLATDESNSRNEIDIEQTMKLEQLYKVCSECELNFWPGSSVG